MSEIQAVILAGGKGTRLSGVVHDRPKPMAEVCGRPFLAWVFELLKASDIRRVVLSTGFMADYFVSELGNGSTFGMQIEYATETTPLGTGGGLRNALPKIQSDPVLVLNGDSWCQFDIRRFLYAHGGHARHDRPVATILLTHVELKSRYGGVTLDGDDRVVRFEEKGSSDGPGWINAGVYLLSRSLIESIPTNANISLETDVFPKSELYGFRTDGGFIDIGTPESYQQAHGLFSSIGASL